MTFAAKPSRDYYFVAVRVALFVSVSADLWSIVFRLENLPEKLVLTKTRHPTLDTYSVTQS